MALFFGVVKNGEFPAIKKGNSTIHFNQLKARLANHFIGLEDKGNDWYQHGKLLFHKTWIENIWPLEPDTRGKYHIHGMKFISRHDKCILLTSTGFGGADGFVPYRLMQTLHYVIDIDPSLEYVRMEKQQCDHCGNYIYDEFGYYVDLVTGTRMEQEDFTYISSKIDLHEYNIKYMCVDCILEQFHTTEMHSYTCENCGGMKILYNPSMVVKKHVCVMCDFNMPKCHACGKRTYDTKRIKGKQYCPDCIRTLFNDICIHCLRQFPKEKENSLLGWDVHGNRVCNFCDYLKEGETWRNYSFKPKPSFKGNDSIYYGMELEIGVKNNPSDISRYMDRHINKSKGINENFVYIKSDSSVNSGVGIEIVTHPASYTFIKDNKPLFDRIFDIKYFGGFVDKTCGMHVHISKNGFHSLHLKKFLSFIYGNPDYSYMVSERNSREWVGHYCSLDVSDSVINDMVRRFDNAGMNRHIAVNLEAENTVEVRIFQGVIEWDKFIKNVQFVSSVYEFTKDAGISDISTDKFHAFLIENKNRFKELYNFINKKLSIERNV